VQVITRPFAQTYHRWHPHATGHPIGLLRGGAVAFSRGSGPAGPVGPVGTTDRPYVGMDPTDRATWVRPWNPQPGMIGWLNFDGACPNPGQVIS
jgi:hypothetical protein